MIDGGEGLGDKILFVEIESTEYIENYFEISQDEVDRIISELDLSDVYYTMIIDKDTGETTINFSSTKKTETYNHFSLVPIDAALYNHITVENLEDIYPDLFSELNIP